MSVDEPLAILWDDPHLLVVNKPADLLTQGVAGGQATLEDRVRLFLDPDHPREVYLGTVHRLDRPVSGVIVWAKTPKAARRLAEQFGQREVEKEYWAVVEGEPLTTREVWADMIGPVDGSGRAAIGPAIEGGRRAVTRVERLDGWRVPDGLAVLRLLPETGRTHQLRAQAASRERPIVGDLRYGATRPLERGIALHAARLAFDHPTSRQRLVIEARIPQTWSRAGIARDEG